jgi:hypothetical protein
MPRAKFPVPVLLALVALPALLIGATLWMVGDLVPACEVTERQRLTSPDQQFDLVVFSRFCGDTQPNTQAALVPPGDEIPFDAASFFSTDVEAELSPQWLAADALAITRPANAEIYRDDETVAGITVTYR